MRSTGLLIAGLAAVLAFTATGCGKRCDSADGCKKTCKCNDSAEAITIDCAMTFNCNPDGKVCDTMYDRSCDEICNTYAAVDACGRQCTKDEQCLLRCTCEIENVGSIICEQPFDCREDVGVCEAAHGLTSCEALCQVCYVGP
ncbi:MAG: hypothetical protein ABIJ09_25530 [Pseudomonadota bacterium]